MLLLPKLSRKSKPKAIKVNDAQNTVDSASLAGGVKLNYFRKVNIWEIVKSTEYFYLEIFSEVESHSKLLKLNLNNTSRYFGISNPAAMNLNLKLTLRANEITFTQQMTVFAGADEVLLIRGFKTKSLGKWGLFD